MAFKKYSFKDHLARLLFRDSLATRSYTAAALEYCWIVLSQYKSAALRANLLARAEAESPLYHSLASSLAAWTYKSPASSYLDCWDDPKNEENPPTFLHFLSACTGSSTTVTNTSGSVLAAFLGQHRQQGDNDSGTRAAQRMANGNSSSVDVDFSQVEIQKLGVGKTNNRERLVEFEVVNVLQLQSGVLDGLRNSQRWGSGEVDWGVCSVSPTNDLGNWLQSQLCNLSGTDKNNSSTSVVDRRGIWSSDGSVLLEHGSGTSQLGLVQLGGLLVDLNNGVWLASGTLDGDWGDLGLKLAVSMGLLGLLVRLDGKVVLLLSGNVVVSGTLFSCHTHGFSVTATRSRNVVRGVGHRLSTSSNNNIAGAGKNVLGSKNNGLHSRGTNLVDGGGRSVLPEPSLQSNLSGRSLANIGLQNVTKEDLLHVGGFDLRNLGQRSLHCVGSQVNIRLGRQGTLERANRRTGSGNDINVFFRHSY
ncbi:hypothetical protein OGAPHI_006077 [Ogataea philodendri]|uniref:Uncharacterized protein n=1 Tax=Ogataea philodendri TaxID=1378263 RepID=A0A9P8NX59_9ASCO|nr:uncharacterized protein OGAPHI_006077 [Ogataea philodendri]KAH3661898.1 hypothetical protein OGAPHI_006077 [Ogataea philodendri]